MSNINSTTSTLKYKHFTAIERGKIEAYLREGVKPAEIARRLGRNRSSISREIARGTTVQIKTISGYQSEVKEYFAETGQAIYRKNRERCKYDKGARFAPGFFDELKAAIKIKPRVESPETFVVAYLEKHPGAIVPCFKTIYRYIHQGIISLKPIDMPRMVRYRIKHHRKQPKPNKKKLGRSIEERPEAVNKREEFGHWEIDLIIGLRQGKEPVLLTLVERMTRKTLIEKLSDRTSETINQAVKRIIAREGSRQFKSITADNGSEFSQLSLLENRNRKIYFAHPYSSYERGTNEVHNGLIREFVPKGKSLKLFSKGFIRQVQDALNSRRRRIHGYETPATLHNRLVSQLLEGLAG